MADLSTLCSPDLKSSVGAAEVTALIVITISDCIVIVNAACCLALYQKIMSDFAHLL